jgi:hypothetical protein
MCETTDKDYGYEQDKPRHGQKEMWSHFHIERIERKDCSSSIELRGKTK